ncbi:TonB-dependent receptor [Caulobacter mirabilis]|uniref:TonB-dependent receptor n=1 Tax=Caulobacter mirabilis TaxID=69666 RepID=A0A2D2AX32_9CAUL|nr:TonB-dependent receptor [Caulobacter mirabilis]ATQ42535.1 hypothetical protein CSW64_09005 [Caulobacter mirabilis]
MSLASRSSVSFDSALRGRRRRLLLAVAVLPGLTPAAALAESALPRRSTEVAPVTVPAPRAPVDAVETLAPATLEVLDGRALERERAVSLGETLARMPGVQNSAFGPAAGRPEIRGQSGPRVAVLVNGMASRDISALSGDHAVPVEPFLADRIEVLKGPAAVLYGGGAIGGAVNVVDSRIPLTVPDRLLTGRAELSGGYNAGVTGMLRLDGGKGEWAWHADALYRDVPDLRIPGGSKSDICRTWNALVTSVANQTLCQVKLASPDWVWNPTLKRWVDATPPERQIITDQYPGAEGRLTNSALKTTAFTLGGSRITADGYIGASIHRYDSAYGVPGFTYITYAHPKPSGIDLEVGLTRVDLRAGLRPRALGVERLDVRVTRTEGDDREIIDGLDHTRLRTEANDLRIDVAHRPWRGFDGAFGFQSSRRDLTTDGKEAWLPSVATREDGLFWLEQFAWRGLTLKAGARWERIAYNVDEDTIRPGRGLGSLAKDRSWSTQSRSVSGRYDLLPWLFVEARYDDVERPPSLIELYANGNHFGILTEEQGDSRLEPERAKTTEVRAGLDRGRYALTVSTYETDFENYIYLGNTGISRTLPVREWRQGDARIKGLEIDATVRFEGTAWGDFVLHGFADKVESAPRFTLPDGYSPFGGGPTNRKWDAEYFRKNLDGDWLPRMPVSRYGADVTWSYAAWRAAVGVVRYDKQDRTAKSEAPSDAYVLVDAHAAYAFDAPGGRWEAFVDAANLTNEEARPHNSFLRLRAPLAGRTISAGVRMAF